jgi:aminoglycoside phosphotransferase (APT) family kinase protein
MMPGVDRSGVTAELVTQLVAEQFPRWAGLAVRPVELDGIDNSTFRLGADMSVRMPSGPGAALQVGKEHRWLPVLAGQLPLPVPAPLAQGVPGCGFPWPWSVYRWREGEPAATARITDRLGFAADLAAFLAALQRIDPAGGPPPGEHNFWRGGPVATYDAETRLALPALRDEVDTEGAAEVWQAAVASRWPGPPVWLHGDVAAGNLLTQDGRLSAVIDFGGCAVGDPACDTAIAWTFLSGDSREVFRAGLPVDEGTWARGRGWVMWKTLITLVRALKIGDAEDATECRRVIAEVLADHRAIRLRPHQAGR